MKFFTFLMAIMVLALSIMPCADDANAMDNSKVKTEVTKSSHKQDNPKSDECSPFCQCACCAGFSVNHSIASINSVEFNIDSPHCSYLPTEVIEVVLPIWQPPQIV